MEDFCDRIPGQHTGRLSLEHQAREAADWQRKVDDLQKQLDSANRIIQIKDETISLLEKRCNNLREELDELSDRVAVLHERIIDQNNAMRNAVKSSPAAGDLTTPATPSAAVGADRPVDDVTEWCDGAKEFCERQAESDTVPRAEYDRVLKLNHHLREVAVMAIVERVPDDTEDADWNRRQKIRKAVREYSDNTTPEYDSKPTNCINPESEDTPPQENDLPATYNPNLLEYGKRYLRDDGQVSGPLERTASESQQGVTHPFRCPKYDITYDEDGSHVAGEQCPCNLVAEYHEPEPSPPAESIAPQPSCSPMCDLCGNIATCFGQYADHDKGFACDSCCGHGNEDGWCMTIGEYDRQNSAQPAESPDVSGEIRGLQYALEWIAAKRAGNPNLKPAAWEMLNEMQVHYEAAVARLEDGESINSTSQTDVPAESPDDWVTLTDPDHVIRKCDQISDYGTQWYGPSDLTAALGKQYKNCGFKLVRCRRKDMPPVPVVPPPLPSPWRPMTDDYPRDKVLWVARDDGLVYTERNPDEWPLAKAIAWMLAVTPVHPNAAPPAVPKTRTVTLREYIMNGKLYWTTSDVEIGFTDRTAVVEVPE